jgi:hypothetical protein
MFIHLMTSDPHHQTLLCGAFSQLDQGMTGMNQLMTRGNLRRAIAAELDVPIPWSLILSLQMLQRTFSRFHSTLLLSARA